MKKVWSHLKHVVSQDNDEDEDSKKDLVAGVSHSHSYGSTGNGETDSYVPYHEIADQESINCPTCKGTGRIPRGQEDQLVALIPYSDQRLRPRRTKLYVSIAVATCLLLCAITIFFLFPRSIFLDHAGLNSSLINFDPNTDTVNINITNILNITNNNFYSIRILSINVDMLHVNTVVGQVNKEVKMNINPVTTKQLYYMVPNVLTDNTTFKICTWSAIKVHNVLLHIQARITVSYLAHEEQVSLDTFEYIDCRSNTTVPRPVVSPPETAKNHFSFHEWQRKS
ncbi:transmembrane protein 106A [Protopterus annectens]|uniref:transmembrane protein 106A n=1 Tax=Protopterus annectens TaxID=7888 RepID=UPI001CF9CB07|nr:transmembrane protein 106A [Protopterus annectens]XP_043911105.1 transmembrane protein 106A [Protopterus annectens]